MEKENNVISMEEVRNEKSNDAKFVEKTGLFNTEGFCNCCANKIDLNDFKDASHSWTVKNDKVEMVRKTVEGEEVRTTLPLQKVVEYYLRHYLHSGLTQVKENREKQEELREFNKYLFDVKRKELVESYLVYVIDAVKKELPKRGIKFNRSNKCLSNIRKILKEIGNHFYDWDWGKCITKGWFIENEEKINQLYEINITEKTLHDFATKRETYFKCELLSRDCRELIWLWGNPLMHKSFPYHIRKQHTLDYLILKS
jgi:hypothetical protein